MKLYTLSCRIVQFILKLGLNLWPWEEPTLLNGDQSLQELPLLIKSLGLKRVLLVTDPGLMKLDLPAPLLQGLEKLNIFCAVYAKTVPNPTLENINEARKLYLETNCEAVLAFGGGSPMDCAKMAAFFLANPRLNPRKIKGVQPLRLRKMPPLFAVPTTAGTGSEATLVAVVTDAETHEKYTVISPRLRPKYAVLDPTLTQGLPPHVTAQTGMDALTHAVEAYIGRGNDKYTENQAREAVRLIFQSLESAYQNGDDLVARGNMLLASYKAGVAFTKAYVGYVHGIAHALGGVYDLPHGLACAVTLPVVLENYGTAAHARLADLADDAGLAPEASVQEKAEAFIRAVRGMNSRMGIPEAIEALREEDVAGIAKQALRESNPLYPVPKIMRQTECEEVVRRLRGSKTPPPTNAV